MEIIKRKGQWPPKGMFHFFGDYDLDDLGEVYCITRSSDSLFLNQVYDFKNRTALHQAIFLEKTQSTKNKYNFALSDGQVTDMDKDETGEVCFKIHGGYSLYPRKYFIFHPEENRLVSSKDIGATYSQGILFDINNDQLNLVQGPAVYSDNKPYLKIFPVCRKNDTVIGGLLNEFGNIKNASIFIYNRSLKILHTIKLPEDYCRNVKWFNSKNGWHRLMIKQVNEKIAYSAPSPFRYLSRNSRICP